MVDLSSKSPAYSWRGRTLTDVGKGKLDRDVLPIIYTDDELIKSEVDLRGVQLIQPLTVWQRFLEQMDSGRESWRCHEESRSLACSWATFVPSSFVRIWVRCYAVPLGRRNQYPILSPPCSSGAADVRRRNKVPLDGKVRTDSVVSI